ncbi:phage tail protein [Sorangium sp. So ce861]|uniref:phage tail protein n=1 Tax=Sorangium sp. So ce861 TaxID=3133323 RepID=UPI003F63DA0B
MTTRPSMRAAADRLWELVPGWTRARDEAASGLLRGLVDTLGVGLDAARDDALRLLDDMFVDTCDPRLVPLIADLVGVSIDPAIPIARQRHQAKYALHLRRRKGTVAQLETLGWQTTGFRTRVREAQSAQRTVRDPSLSARVSGAPPPAIGATAADISGRIPAGKLEILLDVAWPVRRAQAELTRVGPDVHAVDPERPVGLRRADGSPIFLRDDPGELVGRGLAIEIDLIGADLARLGPLTPRFMSLPGGAPVYVPDRTIAIDPERGRVAGPTAPMPGIRAYRRYRLHFWEPLGGEAVRGAPAPQGDGVFTFAGDGGLDPLTDPQGVRLRVGFEGERWTPAPTARERLLIVREQGYARRRERVIPFVLLPPGRPLRDDAPAADQGLLLDEPGLSSLFSIEDGWGWDRFRVLRLVPELGREPPPDDTVEVDVERGRFRVGPAHEREPLRVRYHRPYDVAAVKRRGEDALRRSLPLGRSATLVFRDTAPGSTEVSST